MSLAVKIVSTLWSGASLAVREASRRGLLRRVNLGVRVVSVGNIQAGGAGKTPLVALIANEAHERGKKVCSLSRGYRGTWERSGGVIPPKGEAPRADECGDEPALLHELAPHAWIAVGADRVRGFRKASSENGFDLAILDDGFQNWKIRKDVEIVAVTSGDSSERVHRDFGSQLARADLVIWTKGEHQPDTWGRPLAQVRFELPRASTDRAVWLVTGVADATHVRETASSAGYRVSRHIELPDHAGYSRGKIEAWIESAEKDGAGIATTGKDWIKWRALGIEPARVIVLEPKLRFVSGRESWEKILWG
jgi:tetraacyldisaccharide 4'-kinase